MPTASTRPNILLILTDQQSHAMMSCAGTPWVSTPHLDRLAATGTRFSRAYCCNPVCVPSRFAMFTGRMPSAIGMRENAGPNLTPFTPAEDRLTLGHLLREAGYTTWYGGKIHCSAQLSPERMGFTDFCRDERERLAVETASLIHQQNRAPWAMVASCINPHDICYYAIRACAPAGSWHHSLLENGVTEVANLTEALLPPAGVDEETFLHDYLPPLPPNWEVQEDEPELIGEYLHNHPFQAIARATFGEREWRLHRWAYARLVERVDKQIGVVLDALEASGQAENTLVIVTSDHGDHDSAHRLEHKSFFYEEAARVPWLMRLPGRIPAGRVEDGLVNTGLDLMATLCDYAGVATPAHCRGISLRPRAEAQPDAPVREQVYGENSVSHMLATREWKYVRYDTGENAEQLYDLVNDPGETRNHAADPANAAVLAEMRGRLDAEIATHQSLELAPQRV